MIRNNVRASIAEGAARLINEGMTDYHAAKLKAARQLGVTDNKALPDNHEIESALRKRIALFHADTQRATLQELREIALKAMHWLDRFSPWLAGAVLNGSANEFNAIELELVATEPKKFEIFLHNEGIAFVTRPPGTRERASFSVQYQIAFADVPVNITLFDSHSQRMAAYPRESIRHSRAPLRDAEKRFQQESRR